MTDDSSTLPPEEEVTNVYTFPGEHVTYGELNPDKIIEVHKQAIADQEYEWFVGVAMSKEGEIMTFTSSGNPEKLVVASAILNKIGLSYILD